MEKRKNIFKKKKRAFSPKKGFSLLEILVSVFVLSTALIAVVNLTASSLSLFLSSQYRVIAASLAQEGVELVRNIRDTNILLGSSNVFQGIDQTSGKCIDIWNTTLFSCDYTLRVGNLSLYSHNSTGTTTPFRRRISVVAGSNMRIVTSMVTWGESSSFPLESDCDSQHQCTLAKILLTK